MELVYAKVADWIEKVSAHPWTMIGFLAWCALMPLISVDAANYGISVATAFLLFLTLGSSRRDRKAMHTKLDALVCAVPEADDKLKHIEDRIEAEIDEARA